MDHPILQIVHYSDLHLVGNQYLSKCKSLNKIRPVLPWEWKQGLAGADTVALAAFESFLGTMIASDPKWQGFPVWLVDTGDGTTFGDDAAMHAWLKHWSPRFQNAAGRNALQLVLYGNHEAWPGDHPLVAPWKMARHRDALRANWFTRKWPTTPLQALIPGAGGSAIQLLALNSVDHRFVQSVFALGRVAEDRHWQNSGAAQASTAADDFAKAAKAHENPGGGRHLRVLAMHYPVSDDATPGSPKAKKVLANRKDFAGHMNMPSYGLTPLAHVFLAGHTHEGYPGIGRFWKSAHAVHNAPLAQGQCQFVSGSASQIVVPGGPAPTPGDYPARCRQRFPYQVTVLRLYSSAANPHEIHIDRLTAGCRYGGQFGFLPVAPSSTVTEERMTVVL